MSQNILQVLGTYNATDVSLLMCFLSFFRPPFLGGHQIYMYLCVCVRLSVCHNSVPKFIIPEEMDVGV